MDDRVEISELKYRYCYHMDSLDADRFVALFTKDASFDITNVMEGQGHDDLYTFIDILKSWDMTVMAHMPTNALITVDGDRASGTWYYLVIIGYDDGTTELGQGRYDEEYRRVDGEWLIEALDVTRRHTTEL